ncbi:MAG: hypothetical protein HZB25_01475 [Candidatus Eisenbacteria bacterium]|nr:hypothetical protein [Candidatus Eisenbacteria bacterium]
MRSPADPPPIGQMQVETGRFTVGSLVKVKMSVEVAEGARVEWPRPDSSWGGFELRSVGAVARERLKTGRTRETLVATFAAFDLGALTLPGPVVRVSGRDTTALQLPPAGVLVQSVLGPRDKGRDIRDIKAPVTWRRPLPAWVRPAAIAAGALALLALAVWLVVWLARRRREAERRLPAHVRALRDLEALRGSDLLAQRRYKEYHVRLTSVLRRYLGERCGFVALDMTTGEVLERLREALPAECELLGRVFETSDLVKFARVTPAPGVSEEVLESAVQVVERTRPREPQEDAA